MSAAVSTKSTPSSLLVRTATSPDSSRSRSIQSISGCHSVFGACASAKADASAALAAIRATDRAAADRLIRRLIDDAIRQLSDAVDFDLDDVPGLHPQRRIASRADAARRPGSDHVSGLELRERRAVGDQRWDVEAELADALVLHDLAVEPRREPHARRVALLVGGHEPRSERAACVKILPGRPLRAVTLKVADAAVVEARVARDVLERPFGRHASGAFADHDGEIALVVELDGLGRPHDRLEVADEAAREAHEDHRIF